MAGKIYVAFTEDHDNYSHFHGVFSTAKRAKAIFDEATESDWEQMTDGDTKASCWVSRGAFSNFVVYKTKIDDMIGYLG